MRIVKFEAENFLRLKAVSITPQGNIVQITGPNASGKSSVLNAIFAALAGKSALPADPVRHGEESARITLDMGEIIVRRVIDPEGETTIVVESAAGARFPSPQALLDKLRNALTFDPLAFSRMKAKEQRDQLAKLLGLSQQLAEFDASNRVDFENRTNVSRDLRTLEAKLGSAPVDPVGEFVDASDIIAQINSATNANAELERRKERINAAAEKIIQLHEAREDKRSRAEALLNESDKHDAEATELQEKIDAAMPTIGKAIDVTALQSTLAHSQITNENVRIQKARRQLNDQVNALRAQAQAYTDSLNERAAERATLIASAPMPIPGIGITEEAVTFNDVPFEQASTAEQLRVSAAIGFAMQPELRIMCIRDGSLLDDNSLALLEQLANEHDFQIWLEQVSTSGDIGIVMSEGEVVAVNAPNIAPRLRKRARSVA